MNFISTAIILGIAALIVPQFYTLVEERATERAVDSTLYGIVNVEKRLLYHYLDNQSWHPNINNTIKKIDNSNFSSLQNYFTIGFLINGRNGFGLDYSLQRGTSNTINIITDVVTNSIARQVAASFGGFASTSGSFVILNIAPPGHEPAHNELIHRDGSVAMDGVLETKGIDNTGAVDSTGNLGITGSIDVTDDVTVNGAINVDTINAKRINATDTTVTRGDFEALSVQQFDDLSQ